MVLFLFDICEVHAVQNWRLCFNHDKTDILISVRLLLSQKSAGLASPERLHITLGRVTVVVCSSDEKDDRNVPAPIK